MSKQAWIENIIELGRMGRAGGKPARSYKDLDDTMGIIRPEGSLAMDEAKTYLIKEMKEAGLTVTYDEVGNLYGRRNGNGSGKIKAVLSGSHLDTVGNAGQYDGAYGVVAALEALRRMEHENFMNARPIDMIVFFGEEGSLFSETLIGSSVLAGNMKIEHARALVAPDGRTLDEILSASCNEKIEQRILDDYEYFVEAHIEQGSLLWSKGEQVGCPQVIVGFTHMCVEFCGTEDHAGATAMHLRRDPLIPAAALAVFVQEMATIISKRDPSAVATTDTWKMHPNSPSVISDRVTLTIDIRASNADIIEEMRNAITLKAQKLSDQYNVLVKHNILTMHEPCPMAREIIDVIEKAAAQHNLKTVPMFSGAIHDAMNIATKIKTGMIFVPSYKGISHSPYEWTDWEDLEVGIKVLTETLKELSTDIKKEE